MKDYTINIMETLEKQVTVKAESLEDAITQVKAAWKASEHILDSSNFTGVEFMEAEQ